VATELLKQDYTPVVHPDSGEQIYCGAANREVHAEKESTFM